LSDLKKSGEQKEKMGCPISKKIRKLGCKVAKNETNPDQGDDEDALHCIQQKNITSKKEGKNEKKSKDVRFQKKVVKRLKMTYVP